MANGITRFKELSSEQRARVLAVIGASLVLVAAAEVDIQRRPADQVRGRKLVWRLLCLNALGAVGYFRWGRRPAD